MPPALQAGDRDVYGVELLAAIDWALTPHESDRPQSVEEWRAALLGATDPKAVKLARAKAQVDARPASKAEPATRIEPKPLPPQAAVFDPALIRTLETRLAQYLGPIANVIVSKAAKKAKAEAELIALLAGEISEPAERAAFEKQFVEVSRPTSRPVSVPSGLTNPATAQAASRFPLEVLERAERRLAQHIGAVARVVVKRAAMKAKDEAELYRLLSDEIEDKDDRKAFIRQTPR
jgi:serine/threonine-protein kinase